jgi:leader peptidase (prepilin peptidase)/N-methyltransferase
MIPIFATVFAGLLGLAFGSFLNVCVTRWPLGESPAKGRSHCRSCGRTLAWWENIPLASWLALRGRCRTCRASIGWRYPLVELAVGVLWAFAAWRVLEGAADLSLPIGVLGYQLSVVAGMMVFLWLLVALAVLDAENLWLPDQLVWPGIVLGILTSFIWLAMASKLSEKYFDIIHLSALPMTMSMESVMKLGYFLEAIRFPGIGNPLVGLLVLLAGPILAAASILLIRWLYWIVRRREGLGLGDAKLMAMLAAWLGLDGALLAFSIGCLLGALTALALLALPRTRTGEQNWALKKLPFGTFLCLGAIVSVFWGTPLIDLYRRWAGF